MTTIYEYIAAVRARGVHLVVTRIGTLQVLPELVDWDSRREVLEFLGLRRQVARALSMHEDRLIDTVEKERNIRALKVLVDGRLRESKYQEALGTLDGDAAEITARIDRERQYHEEQEAASLIGACIGDALGVEVSVPRVDRQLLKRQKECKARGIEYRMVEWEGE